MTLIFKKYPTFASQIKNAEVAQLVEHQLPKLRVASSSLVFRSLKIRELDLFLTLLFFLGARIGIKFTLRLISG